METQCYGDYIMETILWRPNTVSIIETKLYRSTKFDGVSETRMKTF